MEASEGECPGCRVAGSDDTCDRVSFGSVQVFFIRVDGNHNKQGARSHCQPSAPDGGAERPNRL